MRGLEQVFRFFREFGEAAAFDCFHDDDFAPVAANHIVTQPSLHQLTVPVNGI